MRLELYVLTFLALATLRAGESPFPEFSKLPPQTVMPENGKLSVAPEGHFMVDGRPRYLPGTIYYEGTAGSIAIHTTGYPESLNWLYEDTLDYQGHQRLGIDASGIAAGNGWIRKYRPKQWFFNNDGKEKTARIVQCGLPIYLDYTCSPWNQGNLTYEKGKLPVQAAFSVPGKNNVHWMPYSATTPEGRALYAEMWRFGVDYMRKYGALPFVYELFNEPDYNDWSDFNRQLFCERLKKQYRDIAELNLRWHTAYPDFDAIGRFKHQNENPALSVEWMKFMEDCFVDICRFGLEVLKAADSRPETLFCVQPINAKFSNVNFYRYNQLMNAICMPTGGGNAVNAREALAIADGKPIFDGETYMGNSRASMRNKLLLQYARGLNASFAFKWCRRPYDKLWRNHDAEGGKKVAEKFPYMLLNPYAVSPEALTGIRQAKEEILGINHLFTPRNRNVNSEIALLFSYPTRRLARAAGFTSYNLYYLYGAALNYAPLAFDTVFEAQLPERSSRYKIIVAAGVNAIEPAALAALETFVKQGGTLLLIQDAMQFDEYGFELRNNTFPGIQIGAEVNQEIRPVSFAGRRLSASVARSVEPGREWENAGGKNDRGFFWRKRLGQGEILFVNARISGAEASELLRGLAQTRGISELARLTEVTTGNPADEVEVHKAVRDGETGYIITNLGISPKTIRFTPVGGAGKLVQLPAREVTEIDADGILLYLVPGEPVVIVHGSVDALEKRYGGLRPVSAAELQKRCAAAAEADERLRKKTEKAFHVSPNLLKMIDLRDSANRSYVDRVAGDGKGGWTDEGENSLHNVPWNVEECNGIPFDFIRPDMNNERACIVLGSKVLTSAPREVKNIRVDSPAVRLYFLHATAWTREGELAFRYVVHYNDGTQAEIPIRDYVEVADWYRVGHMMPGQKAVPGWRNEEKKGLWLYCWENPHPEKTIRSLDAVSAWNKSIPLIGGVTVELPASESSELVPLTANPTNFRANAWSGAQFKLTQEGAFEFRHGENGKDWCGVNLTLKKNVPIPREYDSGFLLFELNGARDLWNKPRGRQPFQVRLSGVNAAGKKINGPTLPVMQYVQIDEDPDSWQAVKLPLKRLLTSDMEQLSGVQVQFQRLPEERSGVIVRNLKLIPGSSGR